jgi:hypothetical protein
MFLPINHSSFPAKYNEYIVYPTAETIEQKQTRLNTDIDLQDVFTKTDILQTSVSIQPSTNTEVLQMTNYTVEQEDTIPALITKDDSTDTFMVITDDIYQQKFEIAPPRGARSKLSVDSPVENLNDVPFEFFNGLNEKRNTNSSSGYSEKLINEPLELSLENSSPSDKNYWLQFYVGSLSVVGLFILFRMIQKHK